MVKSLNIPDVITQPIAENGDKNTIPATNDGTTGAMSQSVGFPPITSLRLDDGGKAVRRADMNGALNLISQPQFFQQNGGFYTFRQDVSDAIGGYPFKAKLWYTSPAGETILVESLKENNTSNFNTNPAYINDGVNWKSILPTQAYLDENYVTLSTNQTITGGKTFAQDIIKKQSSDNFAVINTNNIYTEIRNIDVNGYETGQFRVCKFTDGAYVIDLLGRLQTDTLNIFGKTVGVKTYPDGTSYAYAKPSDHVESLITTAGISKKANGYLKMGNGIIIQWGFYDHGSISAGFTATLNWQIAFTANTYSVAYMLHRGKDDGTTAAMNCEIRTKSATQIKFQVSRTSGSSAGIRYAYFLGIGY